MARQVASGWPVSAGARVEFRPATRRMWWKEDAYAWEDVSSADELYAAIGSSDRELVVVDWFATWCHGCRQSAEHLAALARDPELTQRIKFVRACADEMRDVARREGARALPHLGVYSASGEKLVGLSAAFSKRKSWRQNLRTILANKGSSFLVGPDGFVVPIGKNEAEQAAAEKRAELEKLASFSADMAGKFGAGSGWVDLEPSWKTSASVKPAPITQNGTPSTPAKERFLQRHGHEYGYGGLIDQLYPAEVGCRMRANEHYMDYTGSSVYCQSQLDAAFHELQTHMFGNPHSANPSSSLTQERIEEVRDMVLKFFNANPREYQVVFTKSATAGIKMIGETFPWSEQSVFRYLRENHNSVLGVREYALQHGARFQSVDEESVWSWVNGNGALHTPTEEEEPETCAYNLFAYPPEDNFAGVKYPMEWVTKVQDKSRRGVVWKVLLDAAAFAPTQPLDLTKFPADFTVVSFYKIFGFPTGLGALIIRVDAVDLLNKTFWGGGSVALATSKENFHVLKCRPSDRLEDGTVAFLDIILLKHGFNMLQKLGGMKRIQAHVACLTEWLYAKLRSLKHSNGRPIVKMFGKHDEPDHRDCQGGIINFEILKPTGEVFSYKTSEKEAAEAGFHLRTGVECNPGAAYNYIGIEEREIEQLAGTTEGCDDEVEFLHVQRPAGPHEVFGSADVFEALQESEVVLGHPGEIAMKWVQVPLGSLRVSLGYMSRFEDCEEFAKFVNKMYKDRYD